jgi:hypothetical protein
MVLHVVYFSIATAMFYFVWLNIFVLLWDLKGVPLCWVLGFKDYKLMGL